MQDSINVPLAVGDVVMFKINDMVMPCAIVLRCIYVPVAEIVSLAKVKDGLVGAVVKSESAYIAAPVVKDTI